jgi:hypothetical protein
MSRFSPKIIILLVPEYEPLSCTAVEVFLGALTLDSETFVPSCTPVILDTGIIWFPEKVQYVNDLAGYAARGKTRTLDYTITASYVNNILTTEQKSLVLPTHRIDQLTALKSILGDKVVTCSLSYDSRMTKIIASDYINHAEFWNLRMFDGYTVESLANSIPQSFDNDTDYKFDLIDIYDMNKLASFLNESFDQEFTAGKIALWNRWKETRDASEWPSAYELQGII